MYELNEAIKRQGLVMKVSALVSFFLYLYYDLGVILLKNNLVVKCHVCMSTETEI